MLSSIWTGITNAWASFEAWVASWFPGFKTIMVTILGVIGNAAALGQDYITQLTGLPNNVVTGSKVAVASIVLFTLAFWLRGIGDRTVSRGLAQLP